MKKIFTKLISTSLIVFVVAVVPCVSTANETIEELTPKVDALFEELNTKDSPGAAIAIVQDGLTIYQAGYGNANLEYNIPITPKTIFHVSSVSKQFTAYAITLLNDQKLLTLDDDVRKHIPELPDYGKTITLRHLLHHTSGLRSQNSLLSMAGWRLDDVITKDHIFNLVLRQKNLNFDPGEEHLYSNTGYTLLAEVVARVYGAPFTELPDSFRQLQSKLLKRPGGDREMADILALVLHHDEAKVEQAVALAIAQEGYSQQHVTNCLHRLLQSPKPDSINPPAALRLMEEPLADPTRYDNLRGKRYVN